METAVLELDTDGDIVVRVGAEHEPRVCAVQRDHLKDYWPKVRDWVADALEHSVQHELRIDEVLAGCLNGQYLMLVYALGPELAGVHVIAKSVDPRGKPYVAVICCGGVKVEKWFRLGVHTCKAIARDMGADQLVMMGRPGWRPMLAAHGARLRAVVMTMDVWPLQSTPEV